VTDEAAIRADERAKVQAEYAPGLKALDDANKSAWSCHGAAVNKQITYAMLFNKRERQFACDAFITAITAVAELAALPYVWQCLPMGSDFAIATRDPAWEFQRVVPGPVEED
jgi:hypothetical protein